MLSILNSKKKTFVLYIVCSLVLSFLSLFFLFAKLWEIHVVLFIGTVFNTAYLALILFWGANKEDTKSLDKPVPMFLFALLRISVELIGLFLCGLMMYLIPSQVFVSGNLKLQYLFVLLYLVPYTLALILFVINRSREN